MDKLLIRAATAADFAHLPPLLATVDALHQAWYPWLFRPVPPEFDRSSQLAEWLEEGFHAVVAVQAEKVVGFMLLIHQEYAQNPVRIAQSFLLMDILTVAPTARGTGIGRQLVSYAENYARTHGFPRIELKVYAANEGALRFYEKIGFAPLSHQLSKPIDLD